jgi:hypothetical protein
MDLENKIALLERLYCNCSENSETRKDFIQYLENPESELTPSITRMVNALSDLKDFLPGGKYELNFAGAAKEYFDLLFGDINFCQNFYCKTCCPICKNSTKKCPFHCCLVCISNIIKMNGITGLEQRVHISAKDKKDFISLLLKKYPKAKFTTGYFHSEFDIAVYLYSTYSISQDLAVEIMEAL